jgi:membrane protein implicated in regulation of membrane protease activity
MQLWLGYILLGILFFIAEFFFLTWDFLALWITAVLTWILMKIFSCKFIHSLLGSSILFLIIWIFVWILTKYLLKVLNKKTPNINTKSLENVVWQVLIVQLINWKKVVYYEGLYLPIINESDVNVGDNVKVIEFKDNKVKVKKLF